VVLASYRLCGLVRWIQNAAPIAFMHRKENIMGLR
jgi:hypothetical protein